MTTRRNIIKSAAPILLGFSVPLLGQETRILDPLDKSLWQSDPSSLDSVALEYGLYEVKLVWFKETYVFKKPEYEDKEFRIHHYDYNLVGDKKMRIKTSADHFQNPCFRNPTFREGNRLEFNYLADFQRVKSWSKEFFENYVQGNRLMVGYNNPAGFWIVDGYAPPAL